MIEIPMQLLWNSLFIFFITLFWSFLTYVFLSSLSPQKIPWLISGIVPRIRSDAINALLGALIFKNFFKEHADAYHTDVPYALLIPTLFLGFVLGKFLWVWARITHNRLEEKRTTKDV